MLAALVQYYRRRAAEPGSDVPLYGYSTEKIAIELVLAADGSLVEAFDIRSDGKKRRDPRLLAVPRIGGPRTSGVRAYFLWDKTSYLLGADPKRRPDQVADHFQASRDLHHRLLDGVDDAGAGALLAFLDHWNPAEAPDRIPSWEELAGQNLVFSLDGEPGYLHLRPALAKIWAGEVARSQGDAPVGQCLITGETGPIQAIHPILKGVAGAQTSGAAIVSLNQESFRSYGGDQAISSPVGTFAAFAYTTALNELLRPGSDQRLILGDATTVFWAEKKCATEGLFAHLANPPLEGQKDDQRVLDPATTDRVRIALDHLRDGRPPHDALTDYDPDTRFFVLGLAAPALSRLAVRFWLDTTLGQILERIGSHYRALRIEKQHPGKTLPSEPDFPPLWLLLRQTALGGEGKNISPALNAALQRAVLTGGPYPDALLAAVLERMRAGHGDSEPVSYLRMALVKACLVRGHPDAEVLEKSLMTLNPDDPDPAYRLGRLFAALERAQQLALGHNINATIKDRYFGTASAAPRSVFPNLIRLAQHHLSKADNSGWLDKQIGDIADGIATFPAHLTLEDQGRFALGYYHQRNALWRKKTDDQPQSES